jgi:hypothetical protein
MTHRNRSVVSLSLPPDMARDFREAARSRGTSASELFREIFSAFRRRQMRAEYRSLQEYGNAKAAESGVTEQEIEHLVFGDR